MSQTQIAAKDSLIVDDGSPSTTFSTPLRESELQLGSLRDRGFVSSEQLIAYSEFLSSVEMTDGKDYGIDRREGHTFPDGQSFTNDYYGFTSSAGELFGLARFTPGILYGVQVKGKGSIERGERKVIKFKTPCLLIQNIQGIKGADIRATSEGETNPYEVNQPRPNGKLYESSLQLMLDHVIAAAKPLTQAGWKIGLHANGFNKSIREPYFEQQPIYHPGKSAPFVSQREEKYSPHMRVYVMKAPKDCRPLRALLA